MKDFIINMAVSILAEAVKAKPDSKIAKFLLNDKLKNTIKDVAAYYVQLEMMAEKEEEA